MTFSVPPMPTALVRAGQPQVAIVSVDLSSHLGSALAVLGESGVDARPLGAGTDDAHDIFCWAEDGLPDGFVADCARRLHAAGFAAVGYEPFHDHEFAHTHAFARVACHPGPPSWPGEHSPIDRGFVLTYRLIEDEDTFWDLWFLGTPRALDLAAAVIDDSGVEHKVLRDPDGVAAVEMKIRSTDELDVATALIDDGNHRSMPLGVKSHPAGTDIKEIDDAQ